MARLCIRIAPNSHPTDPTLDAMRTQMGDVVCVVDDHHQFSKGELECGQYRVIDMPGVAQVELNHLVASAFDPGDESKMLRRRAVTLDAIALKTGAWRAATKATKAQIDAITIARV